MDPEIRIELAAPDDSVEIGEMSEADIEYGLPWRWTPPRIARAIRNPATNVAVARGPAGLVAFGIMTYADEVAHLLLFAVRASRRRSGVGSALLVWLEDVARVAGIAKIRLEARQDNAPARAFYRKHGYREVAKVLGMYCGIEDGVRLEKDFCAASDSRVKGANQDAARMDIADIVKDNHVRFWRYRQGRLYYAVFVPGRSAEYVFPVPLSELGDITLESREEATRFLRYIRQAMDEGSFVPMPPDRPAAA